MRVGTRSVGDLSAAGAIAAAVIGAAACAAAPNEPRGATYARYAGATQVVFTNASPERMCGLYMSADDEPDYGDNWLPREGLPSGASITLRVRPGKYKARWDTCQTPASRTYFAATLWREHAVVVDKQQTQLYAYVADRVAPTKRAPVLGRDYRVVRFPGQPIDREPPRRPRSQQVALAAASAAADASAAGDASAAADALPPIAGFVGRMPLSAEQVAARPPVLDRLDTSDFVESRPRRPAPAAPAPAAPGKPAAARPAAAPSLDRRHELADRAIEYRRR